VESENRVECEQVLLDREQGGPERIQGDGVKLRAALTVTKFIHVLEKLKKLDAETCAKVREFVAANRFAPIAPEKIAPAKSAAQMSYSERASLASNAMAKQLLALMSEKKTNLSVAADMATCAEVLALADSVGPHVCVLKTHVDVLDDFTPEFGTALLNLASKHNFLIFEDRKFADIGNTVAMQYAGGVYKIADWSHITNAHTVATLPTTHPNPPPYSTSISPVIAEGSFCCSLACRVCLSRHVCVSVPVVVCV